MSSQKLIMMTMLNLKNSDKTNIKMTGCHKLKNQCEKLA